MTANPSVEDIVCSFFGNEFVTLDNKGRLSIPSRFADTLRKRNGAHHDFLLLSPSIEKEKPAIKIFDPRYLSVNGLERGNELYQATLDIQNRILVPQPLIEYADLKRKILISACPPKCDHLYFTNASSLESVSLK